MFTARAEVVWMPRYGSCCLDDRLIFSYSALFSFTYPQRCDHGIQCHYLSKPCRNTIDLEHWMKASKFRCPPHAEFSIFQHPNDKIGFFVVVFQTTQPALLRFSGWWLSPKLLLLRRHSTIMAMMRALGFPLIRTNQAKKEYTKVMRPHTYGDVAHAFSHQREPTFYDWDAYSLWPFFFLSCVCTSLQP